MLTISGVQHYISIVHSLQPRERRLLPHCRTSADSHRRVLVSVTRSFQLREHSNVPARPARSMKSESPGSCSRCHGARPDKMPVMWDQDTKGLSLISRPNTPQWGRDHRADRGGRGPGQGTTAESRGQGRVADRRSVGLLHYFQSVVDFSPSSSSEIRDVRAWASTIICLLTYFVETAGWA